MKGKACDIHLKFYLQCMCSTWPFYSSVSWFVLLSI